MVSSIYKGSYYQCIVRTDDYYDFFVDTDDDWLKGDRVGINIDPAKIIIEKREAVDEKSNDDVAPFEELDDNASADDASDGANAEEKADESTAEEVQE